MFKALVCGGASVVKSWGKVAAGREEGGGGEVGEGEAAVFVPLLGRPVNKVC